MDDNNNIKPEHTGSDGYAHVARDRFGGNMKQTFQNVSAVLGGAATMKEMGLDWKGFQGRVPQYEQLIELFKNTDISKLKERKGQKYVADTVFKA